MPRGRLYRSKRGEEEEEEVSELERLEEEEAKAEAAAAKRMALKKRKLELKREVEELEQGEGKAEGEKTPSISPDFYLKLAALPEEQQAKVLDAMMKIKAVEKAKGTEALIYGMMAGYGAGRPEASTSDIFKFGETLINGISKGAELAKGATPEYMFNPVELVKEVASIYKTTQPTGGVGEVVNLLGNLQKMGVIQVGGGGPSEKVALEVERIREEGRARQREHEARLLEMAQKHEVRLTELGESKRRTGLIEKGLVRIGRAIASGMEEAAGEEEGEGAPLAAGRVETTLCDSKQGGCGAAISVPPGASEITCAKCGMQWKIERE